MLAQSAVYRQPTRATGRQVLPPGRRAEGGGGGGGGGGGAVPFLSHMQEGTGSVAER